MHNYLKGFIVIIVSLFAISAYAETNCPAQYLSGTAPVIKSAQKDVKTQELCFDTFVVMHSGVTKTPLWSAEHLTYINIESAHGIKRVNAFHAEGRLSPDDRAELADYAKSGYDRGHLAPSGDMPTRRAQQQSFSLANMIPQNSDNNRNLWEGIESAVRTLTKHKGELYVLTGPLYLGSNVKRLNGRVLVPTHIYKLVYDPQSNRGAAYYVKNEAGNSWQAISINKLEEIAGIDFFPNMATSFKDRMLTLPEPTPHGFGEHSHNNSGHHSGVGDSGFIRHTIARHMLRNLFR